MKNTTTSKKNICFVLPGFSYKAIGGYKIVYEYANRLTEFGYNITIFYPLFYFINKKSESLIHIIKKTLGYIPFKIFGLYKVRWFRLNKKIREKFYFSYNREKLLKYDVLIATHISTAFALHNLHLDEVKICIYLIQDFEKWGIYSETDVFESYRFPMKKICIAPWLLEKVKSVGEDAVLIYDGLDFSYFSLTKPIENRNPCEISLMFHTRPEKRFEDSLKALQIVHQEIPEIHISVFTVFDAPKKLPKYFTYYKSPSKEELNEIYNNSAIYVAASSIEGFGLTVAEAMICGCAVACTDNGGFSSMVKTGDTGLLSPVFDYKSLAKNIINLIEDNELRTRLAKNGNKNISKFKWETAVEKIIEVLENI